MAPLEPGMICCVPPTPATRRGCDCVRSFMGRAAVATMGAQGPSDPATDAG